MKNLILAVAVLSAGCPLQVADSGLLTGPDGAPIASGSTVTASADYAIAVHPPAGASISASSSNSSVATVSVNGSQVIVHVVAPGDATITVNVGAEIVTFTVHVPAPSTVATVEVTGPATLALGASGTYTVVAKDGQGNAVSEPTAALLTIDNDLFLITQVSEGKFSVQARGVGSGTLTSTISGVTGKVSVHATGTGVSVTANPTTATVGTALAVNAVATGAGGATGSAARTAWTASGSCTVSPSTGTTTSASATKAGQCLVTGTLDTTLMNSVTLTFNAPVQVASIAIAGNDILVAKSAAATYTATPKDSSGNAVSGVTVTWSSNAVITTTPNGNSVSVVGAKIGAATLTATVGTITGSKSIAVNPASVDLSAATVSVLQSASPQQISFGTTTLRAHGADNSVVPFDTVPQFPATISETHTPSKDGFNFLQPSANQDGTALLAFYDTDAPPLQHVATITTYGQQTTLTVNTVAPDSVSLALKPGAAIPYGSTGVVTPSVLVASTPEPGISVALSATGDPIFSGLPTNVVTPGAFDQLGIAHLGIATLTGSALGKTGSTTVYGVPQTIGWTNGQTLTMNAGDSANSTVTLRAINSGTIIDLSGEEAALGSGKWGSLSIASQNPNVLSANCARNGPGYLCTLGAVAQGQTALRATWTSADSAQTVGPVDFAVTVNPRAAPVFDKGNFSAIWSGPKTFVVTFPAAQGSGTISYNLYGALNGAAPALLKNTSSTADSVTVPSFASTWQLSVTATNGTESAAQPLSLSVIPPVPLGMGVPFIAGRTWLEALLDGSGVHPLAVPVAAPSSHEKTAPRVSPTPLFAGVAATSGTQQVYTRDYATPTLAAAPVGALIQTEEKDCSASARPSTAFRAFGALPGGSLELLTIFTTTSAVTPCNLATVVALGVTGSAVISDEVSSVALAGDHTLLVVRKGELVLIDLKSPTATYYAEQPVAAVPDGALVGGLPAPDSGANDGTLGATAAMVWTGSAFAAYDLTAPLGTGISGYPAAPPSGMGTPRALVAVAGDTVVIETTSHDLQKVQLVSSPSVTTLVQATDYDPGDLPSLGSTYQTGN